MYNLYFLKLHESKEYLLMNLKCLNYLNLELKNQTVYLQSDQDEKILENKTLENHKLLKLNFHKLIVFYFYYA